METLCLLLQGFRLRGPHSLGKLIEWKLKVVGGKISWARGPHSLGKLIEWKPSISLLLQYSQLVPTRWGN